MSKIKIFSLLAIALVAVLVLTACNFTPGSLTLPTSTADPNAATAEPVEPTASPTALTQNAIIAVVRVWHDFGDADSKVFDEILALFKKEYPNVTFKITQVATADLKAKFEGDSTNVDLVIGPAGSGQAWLDAYIIQDISLMLEAETGWSDTWTPEALAACKAGDAAVSSPVFVNGSTFEVAYLTQTASYNFKTAAWELMKFLTRPNIQKLFTDAGHSTVIKAQ
jgi:ABC-type glycerol-3-phosphate transport system substrate-binding protein